MKYKVSRSASPSDGRGASYHKTLSTAVAEAQKRVNKYGKRYYVYKYMSGDPSVHKYPFWSKVKVVVEEKK